MSMLGGSHFCRALQRGEDLAGNVAFEAADDFDLAHSFAGAVEHVRFRSMVVTEPDYNDAMERSIGLAVTAAVQAVPVGLARGSRYRTHPTQRGKGSLGAETFGIAPSSDQEGRRRVGSHAEDADQRRRCRLSEPHQLGFQVVDLIAELTVAAGQRAKGVLGCCRGIDQWTGAEALAPSGQSAGGEPIAVPMTSASLFTRNAHTLVVRR